MSYYAELRRQHLEQIMQQRQNQEPEEMPEIREKVQTEFIKVDQNGEFLEPVLVEHYEDEEPEETEELKRPPGQDKRFFKPKYNKSTGAWVEGLPAAEVQARENEIKNQAAAPTPEDRLKRIEERLAFIESKIGGPNK